MKESGFQFSNPVLSKVDFRLNEDYDDQKETEFNNTFHVKKRRIENSSRAIVELNLIIGKKDFSNNIPYFFELTIGSIFKWNEEFDDAMVSKLLTQNAPALLLSYARPMIASITNSSGKLAYNIPFMNFTE